MDIDTFWALIDKTRIASLGSGYKQIGLLVDELAALPEEEIIAYYEIFEDLHAKISTRELSDFIIVLTGGVGDSGFKDVCSWLVGQGKTIYEAALKDPESIIDEITCITVLQVEQLAYVAPYAYERKTGREIFDDLPPYVSPASDSSKAEATSIPKLPTQRVNEEIPIEQKYPKAAAKSEECDDVVDWFWDEKLDTSKPYTLERVCYAADGKLAVPLASDYEQVVTDALTYIFAYSWDHVKPFDAFVWLTERADELHLRGYVHPEARGRGLGTQILEWAEKCANLRDTKALVIQSEANTPNAHALYTANGYEMFFAEEVMRRDLTTPLPASSLPEGFTVKTWSDTTAPLFYAVYTDAFSTRPGFSPPPMDEWIEELREEPNFRPDLSLLALSPDDEPTSYTLCDTFSGATPWRDDPSADGRGGGWISQVGTKVAWRGKGIVSALMVDSMRKMAAENRAYAGLHVNINNPGAIRTYERIGFEIVGRRARYRKALRD